MAEGGSRTLRRVNAVLAALLALLLVYLLVIVVVGSRAVPGTTAAERTVDTYAAVRAAAREEVDAFLEIDYRKMDPLLAKVLDGATGSFRAQYRTNRVNLKAAAEAARAVSTGEVEEIGISKLGPGTATLYVAADAVVRNRSTGKVKRTKACPHDGAVCRYYRLKVTMDRVGSTWKMSGLDFVS